MEEEKKIENQTSDDEAGHKSQQIDYESDSSTNSDDAEKCPICLLAFGNQEIGKPEACGHAYCFLCIFEWSKVVKTCPVDRREFSNILVFENLESTTALRTVAISEQISLKEFTNGELDYTPCEICRSHEREDVMLLCDGCDKGFHMDCLIPALQEIPEGNWYCVNCDNSENENSESEVSDEEEEEADVDEIYDLQNEIVQEIGQLPSTRLRDRQQPQIIRTLQSERIRNAILARRSLRSAAQNIDNTITPSTSRATPAATRKPAVRKRKTTRRRKRRVTKVVEYEIRDGQKFPIKTTRVIRRRKRKSRKIKKVKRSSSGGRKACTSTSFKGSNANVYALQKGRQRAGLSNFNIFEPSNQLDYVPDDDFEENDYNQSQNSTGSTLIQSVVNYTNPLRRQALIKKRVIDNFTTTSSNFNLIDSILGEHSLYDTTANSNKLSKEAAKEKIKKSTNDQHDTGNHSSQYNNDDRQNESNSQQNNDHSSVNILSSENTLANNTVTSHDKSDENVSTDIHNVNIPQVAHQDNKSPQKKKKSTTFDMFGDSPVDQEDDDGPQTADICPIFSIYGSVNRSSDENLAQPQQDESTVVNEENIDLVQMSSDGEHNVSEEIEPPAVVRSQPASPDLENDQIIGDERSYTPPIVSSKEEDKSDDIIEKRNKKDHKDHHRKHKRRELERYNVRERIKDRSPRRVKDRYGRNRTRSRSRSNYERYSRRRSRSYSRDRHKSRNKKSRTPEKRRRRSYSSSRGRDSSSEKRNTKHHHRSRHKRSYRKSKSLTPQHKYRDNKSPRRRDRSTSEKSKKKKRRNRSKDDKAMTSHTTKEVYTSGENILVSVNFSNNNNSSASNNQDDKRSTRSKSSNEKDETIVDITTKKKINVNSKPVAIIDLARSPFKELTPEYKKESNVIELSDSEGEKHLSSVVIVPKSPDSTKLYDPFDILNSPSNENVTSSQTSSSLKALNKNNVDFTNKLGPAIIKNLNIPLISNNEENLVSSSSSVTNLFDKVFQSTSINNSNNSNVNNNNNTNTNSSTNNKLEVIQDEVIQLPSNTDIEQNIESPYSPGNDFDDTHDDHEMEVAEETTTNEKQSATIFDELFGSSTPPFLEKAKNTKKSSTDPDKYLNKLKRQERVIEEVKLVIKPYYSRRIINKDQYKEIMRKAVPKICHNKSGEINPTKIKQLIDSYVKFYTHKKKREVEEVF